MLSVAASVSKEGTQLPGRYYPTPPHPPASGDDAMLSVAASVSEEGTQLPGRYYPTPHRIWRRCHVECGHKCVKGRNAAARTSLSRPTPPHPTPPPASGDDAMLSLAASVSEEGTQLPGHYYPTHPTPPHPPRHLETMLCWLWPQLWRGCWLLSRADGGWGKAFFWLRNPLVLVAESPFFGCGIVFFWLRNRLFLVAEAPFFGCGSVSDFGCGIAEIWLRKRRNMVSESEFIPSFGVRVTEDGYRSQIWWHWEWPGDKHQPSPEKVIQKAGMAVLGMPLQSWVFGPGAWKSLKQTFTIHASTSNSIVHSPASRFCTVLQPSYFNLRHAQYRMHLRDLWDRIDITYFGKPLVNPL